MTAGVEHRDGHRHEIHLTSLVECNIHDGAGLRKGNRHDASLRRVGLSASLARRVGWAKAHAGQANLHGGLCAFAHAVRTRSLTAWAKSPARIVQNCLAVAGDFAHPTHHLLAVRVDQYTDMPAPSVVPSPLRLASSKHASVPATSGISMPHLAPSASMMRRSLMQLSSVNMAGARCSAFWSLITAGPRNLSTLPPPGSSGHTVEKPDRDSS